MSNKTFYTVDVEPDLHNEKRYLGVTEGLRRFEKICDENRIKPILFVTCDCIKKYPAVFKRLSRKGWDISLHGFSHRRFDEMNYGEKEENIKKAISCFKKYLGIKPRGFRAPQHSIDNETLDLLDKYGFEYDSSYHPLNLIQLLFFPKKIGLWIRLFFSPLNHYKIRNSLSEIPASSLIIPFVSLTVRVLPKQLLFIYLKMIKLFYKLPIFYAHSWDFIELKESRIDRTFSYEKLLNKLNYLMEKE